MLKCCIISAAARSCSPSRGGAWPVRGVRPPRKRVPVIWPQTSCCKRALNTTAAFSQRRPAGTAAWALNDEQRGNQDTHTLVCYFY